MTLTYESVECGDVVPELRVTPTIETLVRWAGASGDFTRIHYDHTFATEVAALPDVVVHGPYKLTQLVRMLVDWAGGDPGAVAAIGVRLSKMDPVGEPLVCRGTVRAKLAGEVECDVWVENERGEKTMSGTARVRVGTHE
jgi:acyl dehydratase